MAHILLVDSYDSFTYNLAALCKKAIPNCHLHIIRNDDYTFEELRRHLSFFSAIVVGPGPGSPVVDADIGIVKSLWHLQDHEMLPVLGVCLGMQSLAVECGASIHRLRVVKHGQLADIVHRGTDLFQGVEAARVVRYHSLHVELEKDGDLEELAFTQDGAENGHVTMAIRHKLKPCWGVQYHPESVKTDSGGFEVVQNFWRMAQEWANIHSRVSAVWTSAQTDTFGPSWPCLRISPPPTPSRELPKIASCIVPLLESQFATLCDTMEASTSGSPFVILDSAAAPGRFSVIGCLHHSSIRISYSIANTYVAVIDDGQTHRESLEDRNVWAWIASFMRSRRFTGGDPSIPFWGGLVGILSYELGAYGLDPQTITLPPTSDGQNPDVNLVYVERSLVFDRKTQRLHIQSSLPHDDLWVGKTATMVSQLDASVVSLEASREESTSILPNFILPDKANYISRIQQCQEYLAAGDSYELCLTARTHVTLPSKSQYNDSWELYKSARRRNPAPYSAYLRLSPLTLISTSPERFLSYSRPPHTVCQLRPIKGTISKSPLIDRAAAERALAGSVKEVAENLMIVDLIRHDLHGVVGPHVHVPYFCAVEEYETVWQMVSVIEGQLSTDASEPELNSEEELGWEVLQRSLPPGSMTGAPKKRSVEILRTLEDDQRGVYSGVFGYWDVGGGGDWAVTIRSCFKHDIQMGSDVYNSHGDVWTIGAGGAITALSDPEAEWEEMMLKLQGVLRAFE